VADPPARPEFELFVSVNDIVEKNARTYPDIRKELVWALIWRESSYRPDAVNGDDIGLGGLNFWRDHCRPTLKIADAKDPEKAIPCIFFALDNLFHQRFAKNKPPLTQMKLVLAAYNAGEKQFEKCLPFKKQQGCVDPGILNNRDPARHQDTPGYVRDIVEQLLPFGERVVYYMSVVQKRDVLERSPSANNEEIAAVRAEMAQLRAVLEKEVNEGADLRRRHAEAVRGYETQLHALRAELALANERTTNRQDPSTEADRANIVRLTAEIDRLKSALNTADTKDSASHLEIDRLKAEAEAESGRVATLMDEIRKKDARIGTLELDVNRWRTAFENNRAEYVALKTQVDANGQLRDQDRAALTRLQAENARLVGQMDAFSKQLTDKDSYIGGLVRQLRDRAATQGLDLADLQKHAIAVVNPPPLASGTSLCTSGMSLGKVDQELLSTGTLLVSSFVDNRAESKGVSLPNVFSYTFREFNYVTTPIAPLAGTYVGSAASGDAITMTIEGGSQLKQFQTSLSLKTHKGRLNVLALHRGMEGCTFNRGLITAFLPTSEGQAFLIIRANDNYNLVGYLLTRGAPAETISLLQFRASRVGR